MEYRKLLVDGKQQKQSSELALELPVEPDSRVSEEYSQAYSEAIFIDTASE